MKKFRPVISKALTVLLLCIITLIICFHVKKSFFINSSDEIFKINDDINTLIIGDSHPMASLDPHIIQHSQNISLDSENYFFTYYKLQLFLLNNSHIKNIIIGFAPQNISKIAGEAFLTIESIEKQTYRRYYNLLDNNGKNQIKSFRKNFVEAYLKYEVGIPIEIYKDNAVLKYFLGKKLNFKDYEFIGNYYASNKSNVNIEEINNKIKGYFYGEFDKYPGKSKLNVEYLDKIIKICSSNGIKIFLYRSPVHPLYSRLIPNEAIKEFEEIKNEIIKKNKNIVIMDFSNMELETKYYGDGDHTNIYGARIVSKLVDNEINKELYD